MIIVLKKGADAVGIDQLTDKLTRQGVRVNPVVGTDLTVLGLVGDTTHIDAAAIEANPLVERVMHVGEPFKLANRAFHPDDTVLNAAGRKIGGKELTVIAGPCSVENEEQIVSIARSVKASGAAFLRGGAFKPRTSPYAFQGLKREGLKLLALAKKETGLPIVTEIISPEDIDAFEPVVDIIQVGARSMQNFDLLSHLGQLDKPILLKRGPSATIEEWLMSAEYIMAGGNKNVILCERGIRTFETYTRNTLDISAVAAVKRLSHLPILIDPSHATGKWWMVESMAKAAVAAGADGLMIEVHNDPARAFSDGKQSIVPEVFASLMNDIRPIAQAVGRSL